MHSADFSRSQNVWIHCTSAAPSLIFPTYRYIHYTTASTFRPRWPLWPVMFRHRPRAADKRSSPDRPSAFLTSWHDLTHNRSDPSHLTLYIIVMDIISAYSRTRYNPAAWRKLISSQYLINHSLQADSVQHDTIQDRKCSACAENMADRVSHRTTNRINYKKPKQCQESIP